MRSTLTLNDDTVVKTFHSPRLFYKELASYLLLEKIGLAGVATPKLLSYSQDSLTIVRTKVEGRELADSWFNISREESAAYHEAVASLLYDICRRVRQTDLAVLGEHGKHLSWENFLDDVLHVASQRALRLKDRKTKDTILAAVRLVRASRADIASRCVMTWLHRDLVQDNIITGDCSKRGVRLIDFEHSLIGPIEFEFANEAFLGGRWAPADNKYLYTDHVKSLLCLRHGVRYNFDLDTLMAIIYGLEHFGYGSRVGTYGTQRCAKVIAEKMAILRHAAANFVVIGQADGTGFEAAT